MSTKKNITVREISDKERKALKNGDMEGKVIDLKVDKELPPEVMDFVVQEVVAPIMSAIIVVGKKMYDKGWDEAIRSLHLKVMADCRQGKVEPTKCKKCKNRKECDELAKAMAKANIATTPSATRTASVAGNQAKAAKKPAKAKAK